MTERWSVSTLVPGLHGKPTYQYFDSLANALDYARERAKSGPRRSAIIPGKIYYVLSFDGVSQYRVFRGMRGKEQRSGFPHDSKRREYIFVQKNAGELPGEERTRWAFDAGLSIELLDPEVERERQKMRRRT